MTKPGVVRHRSRVGLLLPLSGRDRALGRSMLRAAQIALFDLAEDDFVLMPFDTKGTPEGAAAATRVALDNGVSLLLGPVFATSVAAMAPLAREADVKVVAFSNNRSVAGDGIFLIGLLPREQVQRVVGFARARGAKRFAALVPNTPFGAQVTKDLEEAVATVGGTLARIERYDPNEADLSPAVRRLSRYELRRQTFNRLRASLEVETDENATRPAPTLEGVETIGDVGFDAILLPVSGQRLKSLAALLPFYDVDTSKVRLLGMASWEAPRIGREPALVGGWFAAPYGKARTKFEKRFRKIYKRASHSLSVLAYDATALAALLARDESKLQFGVDQLTSPNGFAGTAGIFRFLSSGEVQRGLAVMEIRPWKLRVVSPSPKSFQSLAN